MNAVQISRNDYFVHKLYFFRYFTLYEKDKLYMTLQNYSLLII